MMHEHVPVKHRRLFTFWHALSAADRARFIIVEGRPLVWGQPAKRNVWSELFQKYLTTTSPAPHPVAVDSASGPR